MGGEKMKKAWEKPRLEVLDVSMTMKGWKPGKPPKGDDGATPDPEVPGFDS